jgi:hypothetical protein
MAKSGLDAAPLDDLCWLVARNSSARLNREISRFPAVLNERLLTASTIATATVAIGTPRPASPPPINSG